MLVNLMYLIEPLDNSDLETLEASDSVVLQYKPMDLVCMKTTLFSNTPLSEK